MTNKMKLPVIGQRYKHKILQNVVELVADREDGYFIAAEKTLKHYAGNYFLANFEELPDSNPQPKIMGVDLAKRGSDRTVFWCKQCRKQIPNDLAEGGEVSICSEKCWEKFKNNETPNPVDLEKKEVSEVDRALEELKKTLFEVGANYLYSEQENKNFVLLGTKAQNLVNALEAEKARPKPEPAVDENEQAYYEAISKYPKGIKAHSFYPYEPCKCCSDPKAYAEYMSKPFFKVREEGHFEGSPPTQETLAKYGMSKPEPKIDRKEERVEPVSTIHCNGDFLIKTKDGSVYLDGSTNTIYEKRDKKWEEKFVEPVSIWKDAKTAIYHCNFSPDQIWLYEIFINSIEQMQKDFEELKRKI